MILAMAESTTVYNPPPTVSTAAPTSTVAVIKGIRVNGTF